MKKIFLHGLDSSGKGTKGSYFAKNFPEMIIPDFSGGLETRLQILEQILSKSCAKDEPVLLVGSSFGGLMAACFALRYPQRTAKLILMAPALNFPGFHVPKEKISVPTYLLIGSRDTVTPAGRVLPLAKKSFASLEINLVDEDHLLHTTFPTLDWRRLLAEDI